RPDLLDVTSERPHRIKDENLYSKSLVKIPAPRFVVFYNGTDLQPEQQVLRLSDAFAKKLEHPSLELNVVVYNINLGHNQELLNACRQLKEYAQYVAQVRTYAKEMDFSKAVKQAVKHCIRSGILSDFLSKNRAEVIAVSIFEYDEEKHMKSERDDLALMLKSLLDAGKTEELKRALSDKEYREQLYREYFSRSE
ncbi:MAG: hypothetical protein K2N77_05485, partial [Lachnospiraceae bacterium]|nr:hypothetical protein [Lachnospiraceae bacterium]